MKRNKLFISLFVILFGLFGFYACDKTPPEVRFSIGNSGIDYFSGGGSKYMLRAHNDTESIDFSDIIKCEEQIEIQVFADSLHTEKIDNVVNFNIGDNVFYVVVTDKAKNTTEFDLYIYRNRAFNITFVDDTNKETTIIATYKVEEVNSVESEAMTIERDGYIFDCWTDNNERVAFPFRPIDDTTFVARWAKLYSVNFYVNDEVYIKEVLVENSSFKLPEIPQKEGYSAGWSVEKIENIQEDIDVYAQYIPNKYNIQLRYHYQGLWDSSYENYEIYYGSELNIPIPEMFDFVFDGWYYFDTLIENGTSYTYPFDIGIDAHYTQISDGLSILETNSFMLNDELYRFEMDENNIITLDKNIKNANETFDFSECFILSGGAFFRTSQYPGGYNATRETVVNLKTGRNELYITVYSNWIQGNKTYKVIINRNKMFNIQLYCCGVLLEDYSNDMEENSYIDLNEIPDCSFDNYVQTGWSKTRFCYDKCENQFKITEDISLYALFDCDGNMPELEIAMYINQVSIKKYLDETIKDVVIPSMYHTDIITQILSNAFSYSGITSIVIPKTITTIERSAFINCDTLCSMKMAWTGGGKNAEEKKFGHIFGFASYMPKSLKTIEITDEITIADGCFNGCVYVETIILPDSVTTIGDYAFAYCRSLEEIIIPDSVLSVGDRVLEYCDDLKTVHFGKNINHIGNDLFDYCQLLETTITVDENNDYYYAKGNCLVEKSTKTLLVGTNKSVLPDDIEIIGTKAFYNMAGLKEVTLYNGLKIIRESAFEGCTGIEEIVVPNSVVTIEKSAFRNCLGIKKMTIPFVGENRESQRNFVYIFGNDNEYQNVEELIITDTTQILGDFRNVDSLKTITLPKTLESVDIWLFADCTSLENVIFEEGCQLSVFSQSMFYNCLSLKEITIPVSITKICPDAFSKCENLMVLDYQGTYEQWNEIELVAGWNYTLENYVIKCTDGYYR